MHQRTGARRGLNPLTPAEEELTLGLAERRAAQVFQNEELPQLRTRIEQAAGFEVPLEVHWEQLTVEGESHLYKDAWASVFFEPLIAAFRDIAVDEMGRNALKQEVHRVVIKSTGNGSPDHWAHLEGGTLTLDILPTSNAGDVQERTNTLTRFLENRL